MQKNNKIQRLHTVKIKSKIRVSIINYKLKSKVSNVGVLRGTLQPLKLLNVEGRDYNLGALRPVYRCALPKEYT